MIAIGCDHGGFALKQEVMRHLDELGLAYKDFGCYDKSSCDYPDFAAPAARAVASGECDRGIVVCTTGIGISIAANNALITIFFVFIQTSLLMVICNHTIIHSGCSCDCGNSTTIWRFCQAVSAKFAVLQ